MARRRDALDLELLLAFENRLTEILQAATADAPATVLSEIGGAVISEVELRPVPARASAWLAIVRRACAVVRHRVDSCGFGTEVIHDASRDSGVSEKHPAQRAQVFPLLDADRQYSAYRSNSWSSAWRRIALWSASESLENM
jgi:hypothetical protein